MKKIGYMATYPGRQNTAPIAVNSISCQLDKLVICFNEFDKVPEWVKHYSNVEAFIPAEDYKDVGKFVFNHHDHLDQVYTFDDDLIYPYDYVEKMSRALNDLGVRSAIGVHGVIFSDNFMGDVTERMVLGFKRKLDVITRVNLVGTGTMATWGKCLPEVNELEDYHGHVDIGFAKSCFNKNVKIYCINRDEGWLKEAGKNEETLWGTNGKLLPRTIVMSIREFCGFSKLIG